uniref:Uncharacterized protein n=1 Tax=Avena sativa TaxID=4498 RepID=A0ACD6AMG6_AVESA
MELEAKLSRSRGMRKAKPRRKPPNQKRKRTGAVLAPNHRDPTPLPKNKTAPPQTRERSRFPISKKPTRGGHRAPPPPRVPPMVSDQELARYVETFVRQAAALPGAATAGISPQEVARQLGAQLGVDLAPRAPLIRDILVALLSPFAPASRRDPFALDSSPHAHQPHFATTTTTTTTTSTTASASAPANTGVPHFFSQHLTPQQLQSYYAASQQYQQQHRVSPPAGSQQYQQQQQQQQRASPPAASPYDAPGSFGYAQPGGAQLQSFVQMQQYHQQQQQQMAAAAMAAANAATAGQSPRGPVSESPRGAASARPKKESASTGVKRKGGTGGLNKVCGVSPELQAIVGEPTMARTEIVRQLWAYIRRNDLQDPNNKRKIICNDELRLVFETDCTDMFKMNKLLAKHIRPLEPASRPCSHTVVMFSIVINF